jgi:hypothetical protein
MILSATPYSRQAAAGSAMCSFHPSSRRLPVVSHLRPGSILWQKTGFRFFKTALRQPCYVGQNGTAPKGAQAAFRFGAERSARARHLGGKIWLGHERHEGIGHSNDVAQRLKLGRDTQLGTVAPKARMREARLPRPPDFMPWKFGGIACGFGRQHGQRSQKFGCGRCLPHLRNLRRPHFIRPGIRHCAQPDTPAVRSRIEKLSAVQSPSKEISSEKQGVGNQK